MQCQISSVYGQVGIHRDKKKEGVGSNKHNNNDNVKQTNSTEKDGYDTYKKIVEKK